MALLSALLRTHEMKYNHLIVIADLNLPICAFSALIALIFLNLPTPEGTWRQKLGRLDWAYVKLLTLCVSVN